MNVYEGPPFKYKATQKAHSNFVNCVRYAPNGDTVVSVGSDSKAVLYNGDTGEKVGELLGHKGTVYAAAWSGDSAQLLTVRRWPGGAGVRRGDAVTAAPSPPCSRVKLLGRAGVRAHALGRYPRTRRRRFGTWPRPRL